VPGLHDCHRRQRRRALLVTHWDRPWSVWASDGTRHATLLQACGALQLPFGRLLVRDRQLGAVPVAALVGVAWRDPPQLPKWGGCKNPMCSAIAWSHRPRRASRADTDGRAV